MAYKKILLLGNGTYGNVYLVEREGKQYALKETSLDKEQFADLYIAMENSHPNIIKGEDFFFTRNSPTDYTLSLVLELADSDLVEFISQDLEEDVIIRLFYELLSAVSFLHESKFYHCDIKPDNILIKDQVLKLADFSLTSFFHSPLAACQSTIYSPPEIFRERKKFTVPNQFISIFYQPIDRRFSDIWACGAVFVYMLTGRDLFPNEETVDDYLDFVRNPKEYLLRSGVPRKFLPILLTILEPREKYRVRTVKEILSHDFFRERSYQNPIQGFNSWKPLVLDFKVDREFLVYLNYLEVTLDYFQSNAYTFNASINFYYYLYERLARGKEKKEAIGFILACYILSYLLYVGIFDIEYIRSEIVNPPPSDVILAKIVEIVEATRGVIYFPTLATLAFSELALKKSKEVLLDPTAYKELNIVDYMTALEAIETPEERENRVPVTYITKE